MVSPIKVLSRYGKGTTESMTLETSSSIISLCLCRLR